MMEGDKMSPKAVVRYTENDPKWVQADYVKENRRKGNVVVEAWGYQFKSNEVKSQPADQIGAAKWYILVEHPTGNWLEVWW